MKSGGFLTLYLQKHATGLCSRVSWREPTTSQIWIQGLPTNVYVCQELTFEGLRLRCWMQNTNFALHILCVVLPLNWSSSYVLFDYALFIFIFIYVLYITLYIIFIYLYLYLLLILSVCMILYTIILRRESSHFRQHPILRHLLSVPFPLSKRRCLLYKQWSW